MTNTGNTDDYEDFMGAVSFLEFFFWVFLIGNTGLTQTYCCFQTVDSEGVKYAKQPKPINMKLLKGTIIRVLKEKLELDVRLLPVEDIFQ